MVQTWRLAVSGLVAVAALSAHPCFAESGGPPLKVFAAASLKCGLERAGAEWTRESGQELKLSFASSAVLAKQISHGLPADIYASAHAQWMDWVAARDLIVTDTRVDLLGNSLVLVAPRGRAVDLPISPGFPLAQSLGSGRLALGNPASVPAGIYAKEALTSLRVWDDLRGRTAYSENVRVALTYVARGEAPFGVVYASDALAERRVKVVGTFPKSTHAPIRYVFAQVASSNAPQARPFLTWLSEAQPAATAFQSCGFEVLAR